MQRLAESGRRLLFLFRRRGFERDLEREVAFHLEMKAQENAADGMDDGPASSAARRQFGNQLSIREASSDIWGWGWFDRLGQDIRHAIRTCRHNPVFTTVTIAVLALGIGGNTAIFSLANALVLNPFPYPEPDRLVVVQTRLGSEAWHDSGHVASLFAWQERSTAFDAVAAYGWSRSNVTGESLPGFDGPERMVGGRASASFLRVLQVRPALGRFFTPDEDRPDGPPVIVLGYGLWQRSYGGRRDVLGKTLRLNGRARTIVGVMPRHLPLPGTFACEFWTPIAYSRAYSDTTYWTGDVVIGRLKRGTTPMAAEAQLNTILRAREQADPSVKRGRQARVIDIGADIREYSAPSVRVLGAAVGLVLLLACVNLAGLLTARGAARAREMAVRAALGAGRSRLVRQMLTESVLLSLAGGAVGMLIASWGVGALDTAAPPHLGLSTAMRIDRPVLAFALALSALTGVLFGLLPAIHGSKSDLAPALKGTPGVAGHTHRTRTLSLLVVTEIALATVLLTGGGLLMKSFIGLTRVDTGVRTDHLLTFELSLDRSTYDSPSQVGSFSRTLLERIRSLPGVVSAAAVSPLPMSRQYSGGAVQVDGHPRRENAHAQYLSAGPGYFRTIGQPVVLGREFDQADAPGTSPVVVVNETFTREFLPGENPLAQTIRGARIIGVVADVLHDGPGSRPDPQIYASLVQFPSDSFGVAVRTATDPTSVVKAIRAEVSRLDRDLPLYRVRTMEQVVSDLLAERRITSTTIFGFALFALLLAALGIYGVIAYSVEQRTHEIGVRVALGASRPAVLALVVRGGLLLALAGLAIGLPAALAASRFLATLLEGVSVRDAAVFAAVPAVLLVVALAATWVPARRATAIDPLEALRCE
jgi:predicted permease